MGGRAGATPRWAAGQPGASLRYAAHWAIQRRTVAKSGGCNATRSPEERDRGWRCKRFTPGAVARALAPRADLLTMSAKD
ncbi:hypothetical protein BraRD5C2_67740 [Bradyrhizobium sp. RD5-C2]|nr:hypothetical protein BraRD5C2_67740 [Bradyrhizobium sp. RD5-C2]